MMTCSATLRHNAGEAAVVGAGDERVRARDGAHGSAVRLERRRDRLRRQLRLCRSVPLARGAAELRRDSRRKPVARCVHRRARRSRPGAGRRLVSRTEARPRIRRRERAARGRFGAIRGAPRQAPAPPDIPRPVVYDPTVGPSLSPTQSALQAAMERLVARDDHRNPLGAGDWRAARAAIAAFYARRAYAPVWVERKRPDRARGGRRSRNSSAPATTASTCPPSLCRAILGPALTRMRSPKPKRPSLRRWSPMPNRRRGSRVPPVACLAAHLRDAEHRRSRRRSG